MGFNIDDYSFEDAVCAAKNLIDTRKVSQVVTINPEIIQTAEKDPLLAEIINSAEMVIPDGIGIKLALRITGKKSNRIPGIDFAYRMLKEASVCDIPVAIIGAKEEIVEKAVTNLKEKISGLNIVYYHHGYFTEDDEIYSELKSKSPKLILAALGSPRQEKFIYNAKKVLNPALMIGIGGSLDVWSGSVKRAPALFRAIGLEWLYRTVTQPSRLKRIFPCIPIFLFKVLSSKSKF